MSIRVSKERLLGRFAGFVTIDSETFRERELGERVVKELRELGLTVRTDLTSAEFLKKHPESYPNIYATLPGNADGEPVLLSAHLDTVSPGKGKRAVFHEDGTVTSDGSTVLGADDLSGLTAILEALTVIKEQSLPHPEIGVLITAAEEAFCEGSRALDFDSVTQKRAYVLDLNGSVGTAAVAAPTIYSFSVTITGKAAHAGFSPELGINAISIAAKALVRIPVGRLDSVSTVNFGTIRGGTQNNVVPDSVTITGEVRSLEHERASELLHAIAEHFREAAEEKGGKTEFSAVEHVRAYRVDERSATVRHFQKAAKAVGLPETKLVTTCGGSDANRLNEHGIEAITVACAMENVHTTAEYTICSELVRAAELATALLTVK